MNDIVSVPAEEVTTLEPIPAVVNVTIHTAYFDVNGKLLIISSGGIMSPPANAVNWVEVDDPTNYNIFYDGEMKLKSAFNLVNTRNKLSGIPPGTIAYFADGMEVVDDGEIEFIVNYEGQVDVFLDHPHYLSESVAVEVGP